MIDITMLSDQYSVRRLDDSDADDILDFLPEKHAVLSVLRRRNIQRAGFERPAYHPARRRPVR